MRIGHRLRNRRKAIKNAQHAADTAQQQGLDAVTSLQGQGPTYDQLTAGMPQSSQLQTGPMGDAFNRSMGQVQAVAQQGWTPQDQAALGAAQRQQALQEQGQRMALFQQAQARGMGQGGAMLAGGLAAQQGAANRGADTAAQLGMAGRDRAYNAALQSGQMAQGQGQALDAFNQWATGVRGGAAQQGFQNQFNTAGAVNQAYGQYGDYQADQAQRLREQQQQMRQGIFQGASQFMQGLPGLVGAFKKEGQ